MSSRGIRLPFACLFAVVLVFGPFVVFAGGEPEVDPDEVDPAAWDEPQAPELAALVEAGELPPLEERLPVNPKVVEPDEIGTYGGTARTGLTSPTAHATIARNIVDGLVHWNAEGSGFVRAAVADFDISEDAREYTFTLRERLRWHDGERFTSEDISWWWENHINNEEITPVFPSLYSAGGEQAELEIIDEETYRFVFAEPHPLFLDLLGNQKVNNTPIAQHYGETIHADFNDEVHEIAQEEGFDDWVDYYDHLTDYGSFWTNPERPTIAPWVVAEPAVGGETRVRFERNPYYYRVDNEGNQLPYINEFVFDIFEDAETMLLQALAGEIDQQMMYITTIENRPVLYEHQEEGNYRIYDMDSVQSNEVTLALNKTHDDETVRELARNRDFRAGLSHAIDRDEIIDIVYAGVGEPRQPAPDQSMPWYNEQLEKQHLEYDVDLANEYFDRAGYEKDDQGRRIGPDGEPISLQVEIVDRGPAIPVLELIERYWADVGVSLDINVMDQSLWWERLNSNQQEISGAHIRVVGRFREVLARPRILIPAENEARFAMRWSAWYGDPAPLERGVEPEEPPEPVRRQLELYDKVLSSPPAEHDELMSEITEIAAERFPLIGTLGHIAYGIVHNRIGNGPPAEGSIFSYPMGDTGINPHWSERFIRGE